MRRLILSLIFASFCSVGAAQNSDTPVSLEQKEGSRQALLVEVAGNGGLYSFNYERLFSPFVPFHLRWRVGLSFFPRGPLWTFTVPLSVIKYVPLRNDHVFFGTGQTLILSNTKGGYLRGTFRLGYKHYFKDSRMFIEVAYTPFYSFIYNFQWDNWFGASVGFWLKPKES